MSKRHDDQSPASTARVGLAYGLAAFTWWGFAPIYFKAIAHVPPAEILAHRIVWSVLLLAVLMRFRGRWAEIPAAFRNRRAVATLMGTTVLIAVNWFVFIWAIENGELLQASLGYFINPLMNVLLGFVFLRERLRRWQTVSVVLAAAGVVCFALSHGETPRIALILATSFGLYGLLRKTAHVDSMVGLTAETALLTPIALLYLGYLANRGDIVFGTGSATTTLLLALAGVITAVPLLWFVEGVRRLRLSTMGFLQYIAPSLHFLLAIVFGEAVTRGHAVAFVFIWSALVIYSLDSATAARRAFGK